MHEEVATLLGPIAVFPLLTRHPQAYAVTVVPPPVPPHVPPL